MGLPTNEHHLVFRWARKDCKVLFSVTKRGEAASCHIASDKKGLRQLKKAIEEWCLFVFWLFDWCKMILAQVLRPSVGRLITKCGFNEVAHIGDVKVYVRSL